jgi:hypothetical protein
MLGSADVFAEENNKYHGARGGLQVLQKIKKNFTELFTLSVTLRSSTSKISHIIYTSKHAVGLKSFQSEYL